jgi:teichuronic acid biosynthesis glycosyltransferase TuaH
VSGSGVLLFCAGNHFDGPPSTDRRLALAIAETVPVLWVDPPISLVTWVRKGGGRLTRVWGFDEPAPNLRRLRLIGPPGLTRPLGRSLAGALYRRLVRRAASRHHKVFATVLASPLQRFPLATGVNVLYVTDEWVAGASLMGLDARYVQIVLEDNLRACHVLAAVSQNLLASLRQVRRTGSQPTELLLPNGCDPDAFQPDTPRPRDVPGGRYAVLVGQLNERLDVVLLEALAAHGVPVVIVGPRSERSGATRAAFDRLFRMPTVHYLGARHADELSGYLGWASVGLVPYADSAFNRSSFPLKTLDYLAAGLTVVSTDLPAARWLASESVALAPTVQDFVRMTETSIREGRTTVTESAARALAAQHSWAARARKLTSVLEQPS